MSHFNSQSKGSKANELQICVLDLTVNEIELFGVQVTLASNFIRGVFFSSRAYLSLVFGEE